MTRLRDLVRRHRLLAVCALAGMLLLKLLIPAGYMPAVSAGGVTLVICTGYGPQTVVVPAAGSTDASGHEAGAGLPCAFAVLGGGALAAIDPLLLILAIAFVFAVALRVTVACPTARIDYLRPPLRGPPARA